MWEYMLIPHQLGLDVGIRSQDCMWEYVMCICDTVLWSIICMYFWITLRFDYIYVCVCVCVCVCSMVLYMFGKLYRIFWVKLWNQTRALLDSIPLHIVYNCLLDVWLTPSMTEGGRLWCPDLIDYVMCVGVWWVPHWVFTG